MAADAERLGPRPAGASGADDLRGGGHELGLPDPLGQRPVHHQQPAPRGVGHPHVALGGDDAAEGKARRPAEQHDGRRSTEPYRDQKAAVKGSRASEQGQWP